MGSDLAPLLVSFAEELGVFRRELRARLGAQLMMEVEYGKSSEEERLGQD